MERPEAYLAIDRCLALAGDIDLPDRANGAALFADISGFTPLSETLARELGASAGADELIRRINGVYSVLIAAVHRYGGSVVTFSGDAITCWFDADCGHRAVAAALTMQRAMSAVAAIAAPGGRSLVLALKVAVAAGSVRRFKVGDPAMQMHDVLASGTLDRLAVAAGACQSYGRHSPYLVWRPIMRQLLGVDAEAPEASLPVISELLSAIGPRLVERLPLLGPLLGISISESALTAALDARTRKSSLESLVVEIVRAFAQRQCMLLVLEDCHWLDDLSRDLLQMLGRATPQLSLLLVLAYRP